MFSGDKRMKTVSCYRAAASRVSFTTGLLFLVLALTIPPWYFGVAAQTTGPEIEVTAWHDCSETLPDTMVVGDLQLQCATAQTFTRVTVNGTIELGNTGLYDNVVIDEEWQCVPSEPGEIVDTLTPNDKCVPLPDNTHITAVVGRPRYGWWLTYDHSVPYGYLLVNYTVNTSDVNATAMQWLNKPQLLDNSSTWGVNDTCGGQGNVLMNSEQACYSNLPLYVTSEYMASCGACGENPYLPLMQRALVEEASNVNIMNGASCGTAALCYACNNTNYTVLEQRVVYQTFAFGGMCKVYTIEEQARLYIDAFVNVSILNRTVANGVLIKAVYDQNQAQVAISMRSPTIRGSLRIDANDASLQVRQLDGYVIVCPDQTATNSTRADGVLGPINWLHNTSGYVPSFRWNQQVQVPAEILGAGKQKLRGAWIYLTKDQYAARFQGVVQPVDQCALTHVASNSNAPVSTNVLYSNNSAVPKACIAPPYNWSNPPTGNYYEQVHPGEGACVPGMDPRYNVEPGKRFATNQTVCQMINQMDTYSQVWGAASATVRSAMDPPPFLPDGYNMDNPSFYLMEVNQQQSTVPQSQLVLMFTPPNLGSGIIADYNLTVDISTDLVPYATDDLLYVVMNSPGTNNSNTLCRYWMPDKRGYYSVEICQLGKIKQVVVDITVSDCDPSLTFIGELNITAKRGLKWVVATDGLSATFKNLALLKNPESSSAGPYSCSTTSALIFNLTEDKLVEIGNTNGALLDSCQVTLDMQVTMEDKSVTTLTQHITQNCAAVNAVNTKWWKNVVPQDPLLRWQVWAGFLAGIVILLIVAVLLIVAFVQCVKKRKFKKRNRYSGMAMQEMTSADVALTQSGVGL